MNRLLTCPICGKVLTIEGSKAFCTQCRIGVNLSEHKAFIMDDAPSFVRESYGSLRTIVQRKPALVCSTSQLFSKDFSLKDTIVYSGLVGYSDESPRIILGYYGVPAIVYKALVLSYKACAKHLINDIPMLDTDTLLSTWFISTVRDASRFEYDEQLTLSTLLAPTWIDCAEASFGHSVIDPLKMSESEMVYCGLTCNKFPILADVEYSSALETIRDFMFNQLKFVHDANERLYRWNKPIDDALRDVCPEFRVSNTHKDRTFVDWLFATNMPWLAKEEDIAPMRAPLSTLWGRYGAKNSVAFDTINSMYEVDNAQTYIKYWQSIRKRLSR